MQSNRDRSRSRSTPTASRCVGARAHPRSRNHSKIDVPKTNKLWFLNSLAKIHINVSRVDSQDVSHQDVSHKIKPINPRGRSRKLSVRPMKSQKAPAQPQQKTIK